MYTHMKSVVFLLCFLTEGLGTYFCHVAAGSWSHSLGLFWRSYGSAPCSLDDWLHQCHRLELKQNIPKYLRTHMMNKIRYWQ